MAAGEDAPGTPVMQGDGALSRRHVRGERTRAQVMAEFQSECVSPGGRAKLSLDLRILERMLEGCPVATR